MCLFRLNFYNPLKMSNFAKSLRVKDILSNY